MPKPAPKPMNLRREIAAILIVKLIAIVAIKLVFFSDAEAPGSEGAAAALLSAPASPIVPARSATHVE